MRMMKDSGVAWIGEIPEEWAVLRLKYIFSERDERCGADTELPLLSVSEYYGVAKRKDKIKEDETLIRAETLEGYKICHPHDIVSNIMLAWKSALGESPSIGIVSPSYCVYHPVSDICTRYFHYLLRTNIYANIFKQYSTGIIDSRLRLYSDKFLSLFVQVPPVDEQHRIADFLDTKCAEIDRSMELVRQSIDKLKEYKKSVITEAVTKGLDTDVPMKDSGVPWIGEIPAGWEVRRLKNICSKITDGSHFSPDSIDEGYPYITAKDVKQRGIDYNSTLKISEEAFVELAKSGCRPEKDDVLLVKDGATTGRVGLMVDDTPCVVLSSVAMLHSNDSTLSVFLMYLIQSNILQEQISLSMAGSALPRVTITKLVNYWGTLPPLPEQQRIAAFLGAKCTEIDTLITHKQALLDKLAEYKKSLIFECVTGKREVPA